MPMLPLITQFFSNRYGVSLFLFACVYLVAVAALVAVISGCADAM